jgi:hypothetical protein
MARASFLPKAFHSFGEKKDRGKNNGIIEKPFTSLFRSSLF